MTDLTTYRIASAVDAADLASEFLASLADAPEALEGGEVALLLAFDAWANASGENDPAVRMRAWRMVLLALSL